MPGKSKHRRGKHPHHNKVRQRVPVAGAPETGTQQQSAQVSPKPAAAPARATTPQGPKAAAANATAMAAMEQSFVVSEIKRIGILTGIIIVILIIAAIIFK
jgi:hypothetical protein